MLRPGQLPRLESRFYRIVQAERVVRRETLFLMQWQHDAGNCRLRCRGIQIVKHAGWRCTSRGMENADLLPFNSLSDTILRNVCILPGSIWLGNDVNVVRIKRRQQNHDKLPKLPQMESRARLAQEDCFAPCLPSAAPCCIALARIPSQAGLGALQNSIFTGFIVFKRDLGP